MKIFNREVYREEEPGPEDPKGAGGEPKPPSDPPSTPKGGEPKPPSDPPSTPKGGDPSPWNQSAPEDWREQLAGEDEAKAKRLGRYTTFDSFVDSAFEAHDAARKGQIQQGLPDNPTEEEVVEYREANGIPADGEYRLKLEEGLELNDNDNEIMKSVLPVALEANVPSATMSAITSAFVAARDAQVDKILSQDTVDKQETDALMRTNWGADYDTNSQMVENLVGRLLSADDAEAFKTGRDGNGKSLMSNPAVLNMLAIIERTINPMSTVPGGQENAGQTARDIVEKAKEYQTKGEGYPNKEFEQQYDKALEYLLEKGEKI